MNAAPIRTTRRPRQPAPLWDGLHVRARAKQRGEQRSNGGHIVGRRCSDGLGAEPAEHRATVATDQHVRRVDATVDRAAFVEVGERGGDRCDDTRHLGRRKHADHVDRAAGVGQAQLPLLVRAG